MGTSSISTGFTSQLVT
ncbi:hypothetical protein D030_3795A, partial [Vibrio parahaemolyticus AQ3810]